jgi:hypothetical protein
MRHVISGVGAGVKLIKSKVDPRVRQIISKVKGERGQQTDGE